MSTPPLPSPETGDGYAEAYANARAAGRIGLLAKLLGAILGGGITMFSGCVLCIGLVAAGGESPTRSLVALALGAAGICFGAVSGVVLYLAGVLVSLEGQILSATLDTATNTGSLRADPRIIAFRPAVVRERVEPGR